MKQQLRASTSGLTGSVLLGRYRIVRELAKGGMGVVYLARAEGAVGFVKPVVIKLLLPEHTQDDRFVRMFAREARILSQLRHPSLVDVLEFGEQDGAYVLVLEYVRGYHVGLWLRYLTMKRREPPIEVLLQITIDVLDALHHAHTQLHPDGSSMQIVHRDVSPSNILLDENGRARLLDFGVARMRGGSHDYRTQVKGFMGKLPYTAPEVFAGGDASPRSDLYACAVVLHEALYGQNVFRAETQAATLQKVLYQVPPAVEGLRPDIPAGLDAALAKALAKAEDERFVDAREFAGALRKLLHEQESELRAQLSDLLKDDFGAEMSELFNLESLARRDDAWRRLSMTPARPPTGTALATETGSAHAPPPMGATVANSPLARKGSRSLPPPAFSEAAPTNTNATSEAPAGEAHAPAAVSSGSQARGARRLDTPSQPLAATTMASQRGLWVALFVVGGLALGAIGLALNPPGPVAIPLQDPDPPPAPLATAASKAPSTQAVAPENHSATPAKAPDNVTPEPHPIGEPKPAAHAAATKPTPEERTKHSAPDPAELTRAFRKQQPKLENCFRTHSAGLEGAPTTQLEFDLDASGKLTRVDLSPRMLANTPLGQCLLQIGRHTAFPRQSRPVSFVIPITAHASPDG
jgi:serine/threonine protein kinase